MCDFENSWQDWALQVEKILWKYLGVFCFNKQHDSYVCKATQIRNLYMLQNLLEWAFNRCGCNFKVLVSSCIHPFICCDTQARYLKTGRVSNLSHIKTCNQVLHKTDWKRTKGIGLKSFFWQMGFWLGKLSGANINHKILKLIYVVSNEYCKSAGWNLNLLRSFT